MRGLRVEHAADDRRGELVVLAVVTVPNPVGTVELVFGDEGPIGVVGGLILRELDGVDPKVLIVAQRPALAQTGDLLTRLSRELIEAVLPSLPGDRYALAGGLRVATNRAVDTLGIGAALLVFETARCVFRAAGLRLGRRSLLTARCQHQTNHQQEGTLDHRSIVAKLKPSVSCFLQREAQKAG